MSYSSEMSIRAWPLFTLAFIRLFFFSIFERSLQNYLYFIVGINESTLGTISSAGAIAYIFAPLLGQFITKKTGDRKAIIIGSILTPILIFAETIYFEPWYLILIRISVGLSTGLFWPNALNLLSKWQENGTAKRTKRFFNYFNFSWNLGYISGLLTGYFWALAWNDYFAMIVSFSMSFLLIPFSFILQTDQKKKIKPKPLIEQVVTKLPPVIEDKDKKIETMMLAFPIIFSWIGILTLTISKSTINFSYPIFIKSFDESLSDLTYIVQALTQLGQIAGLTWINSMKPSKRKYSALTGVLALSLISLSILIFRNILFITIISISSGLFFGLVHGVSMKIMLDYGTAKNTSKYSTMNEIIIGMGFGITPIIAGYVAEVDIYLMFVFMVFFGLSVFLYFISLSRKIKWEKIEDQR